MNIIKKTDVLSSITLIVISVIALWQTIGLTKMSYVFPRSIAIILLFLSSIYLINSIIKIIRNNETSFFDGRSEERRVGKECKSSMAQAHNTNSQHVGVAQ